jgi:uncharacterized DUF497 family protein
VPPTIYFSLGGLEFEWDADKAIHNLATYGVAFREAATTFLDPDGEARADRRHSRLEERWGWLGWTLDGRLLTTTYTLRSSRYRLISARPATKRERHVYDPSSR